jgi:hypothetical protein
LSTIESVIFLLFGGIMLASLAIIWNFAYLLREEAKANTPPPSLLEQRSFRLALWPTLASVGLLGNATVRVHDGLTRQQFDGSTPVLLILFLALIWTAWTGFHWDATHERKWHWRIYVAAVILWVGFVWLMIHP